MGIIYILEYVKRLNMLDKTKVTEILDGAGAEYSFMNDGTTGLVSGMEIAEGLKAEPERVFKTLVMGNKKKGKYFVFMIPVNRKMDAKKAKAVTGERLSFASGDELAEETGYEQGGCSPVGTIKNLPVFFDESASQYDKIIFGAGENSYHVELTLDELSKAIDFTLADIAGDIME